MSDLVGGQGVVRMTIQVTRAETGKVEEYEISGKCTLEEAKALGAEIKTKEGEE